MDPIEDAINRANEELIRGILKEHGQYLYELSQGGFTDEQLKVKLREVPDDLVKKYIPILRGIQTGKILLRDGKGNILSTYFIKPKK